MSRPQSQVSRFIVPPDGKDNKSVNKARDHLLTDNREFKPKFIRKH